MRASYAPLLAVWLWAALETVSFAQDKPVAFSVAINGNNNPASDVQALQSAANKGGRVLLHGLFDFGENGSILLTKDVEFIGDADANRRPKIKGGRLTIRSMRSDAPGDRGPKVTVKDLDFEGASWTPIYIAHARGMTIVGNRITRVRPVSREGKEPFDLQNGTVIKEPFDLQHGIVIGSWVSVTLDKMDPYHADAVTGVVRIEDNEIELTNDAPTKTIGQGVVLVGTTGVSANIARNKITNASRNSIEVLDNFRGGDGGGWIVIQDNQLETPVEGIPAPSPNTPNGIVAGYFFDRAAGTDPSRSIRHIILHNVVHSHGKQSMAIAVLLDGAFVRDNYLTTEGSGAFGIRSFASQVYIGQNRIEGIGLAGIQLVPVGPMTASDNELSGNDFEQFKASTSDVILAKGSHNNRVAGRGTITDLGSDNHTAGENFRDWP